MYCHSAHPVLFPVSYCQPYEPSSSYWYLFNNFWKTKFDFAEAIITILKHATTLCASGMLSSSALVQAELDYQNFNINSRAVSYFTAAPQGYSVQSFVDFIMCVNVCLLLYLLMIISNNPDSFLLISNDLPSSENRDKDESWELNSLIFDSLLHIHSSFIQDTYIPHHYLSFQVTDSIFAYSTVWAFGPIYYM